MSLTARDYLKWRDELSDNYALRGVHVFAKVNEKGLVEIVDDRPNTSSRVPFIEHFLRSAPKGTKVITDYKKSLISNESGMFVYAHGVALVHNG